MKTLAVGWLALIAVVGPFVLIGLAFGFNAAFGSVLGVMLIFALSAFAYVLGEAITWKPEDGDF